MGRLTDHEENVARHYTDSAFDFESARLSKYSPVELAITARYLQKLIPERATVADIGVGVGHYAELLASRGCSVHLVDVTERLLDTTAARLHGAGLQERIIGVDRASATELECLKTETFDVVLLLGPLYHLCTIEERRRAVSEAARVVKKGGLLFAAGINRLSYLRDLFHGGGGLPPESPHFASSRRAFHEQYLRDGNLDPEHAPPIGFAHLTTVGEFRQLFESEFEEQAMVGVESFTSPWQEVINDLPPAEVEAWLELVERTGTTTEGLGVADHFLYIGRRR